MRHSQSRGGPSRRHREHSAIDQRWRGGHRTQAAGRCGAGWRSDPRRHSKHRHERKKRGEPTESGCMRTWSLHRRNPGAQRSGSPSVSRSSSPAASVGAATGLVRLVSQIASLSEKVLVEPTRHHWLRNRCEGPRRIDVAGAGFDGKNLVFELSEPVVSVENQSMAAIDVSQNSFNHCPRIESLPVQLFVIDGNSNEEIQSELQKLASLATSQTSPARFARAWYRNRPPLTNRKMALVLVAKNLEELPGVDSCSIRSFEP